VTSDAPSPKPARLASLDQFRGYTVAGMFLVNFVGDYAASPPLLDHHKTYCSYADTIMPQFLFAVGFALRLAHTRRVEAIGARAATVRVLWRVLWLILIGAVYYHLEAKTWIKLFEGDVLQWFGLLFQTLVHIAVTTLWVLPVVRARPAALLLFAAASGLLHLGLSHAFWLDWTRHHTTIDGGYLGFLTWTIPTLAGAWACHLSKSGPRASLTPLIAAAVALCALGVGLSLIGETSTLPFVHRPGVTTASIDLWTMSQKTGSLTYQTFAAGFSLLVYALFVVLCDLRGLALGFFHTLGANPLAGYLLHGLVCVLVKPLFPKDSSLLVVFVGCALSVAITWGILKLLERRGLYLRL
jgi:predicted acyltransferase